MPIYEYQCKKCKNIFEYFHAVSGENKIVCPECKSRKTEKVISASVPRPKGFPPSPMYEFPKKEYPNLD